MAKAPDTDPAALPTAKGKFILPTAETWNMLVACMRAAKLLPGDNVKISKNLSGQTLHASEWDASINQHPWKVTLSDTDVVTVRYGTLRINGDLYDITIDAATLGMDTSLNTLPITSPATGFVCIKLEITDAYDAAPDPDTLTFTIDTVEIVWLEDEVPDNTVGERYLQLAQVYIDADGFTDITPVRWSPIDLIRAAGEESASDLSDRSGVHW